MNFRRALETQTQTTKLMQPCEGAFHDPTMNSEPTAMGSMASSQHGLNVPCPQLLPMWLGIVAPIPLHAFGTPTRSSELAPHRGNRFDQRQQLRHIMGIRTCQRRGQGNALRVRDDMVFAPRFGSIGGVRSCFFPPNTARTELLSTTARDQSSCSAMWSFSNNTRCSCGQTPAHCQSRKRRQQVMPEPQPISCGKSSQGMPVFKTKRMPVKAFRLSSGLRPGCRRRRGLLGINGSIKCQSSSSTSGFAIHVPSQWNEHIISSLNSFC